MNLARTAPPVGTVTMLFTDIESSSDGVRTFGIDRWEDVLERHEAMTNVVALRIDSRSP